MGMFDKIFKGSKAKKTADVVNYFSALNGYSPVFTNAPESIYEMEITRAAIHSFANICAKLKPEVTGTAGKRLEKILQYKPNPYMNTFQFIYRTATILSVNNTAFIIPLEDEYGQISGFYPLLPQYCEVVEHNEILYLRYMFGNGQRAAVELDRCGILTQFQYEDEFFGSDNKALHPTMQLLTTQNQGIINGIKNSALIRFIAKVSTLLNEKDLNKKRDDFAKNNLSVENDSGLIMLDNTFSDFKQIESKPFIVNPLQMQQINDNVYNYFGTNANILQNKYSEDEYNAYFETKIEPFALQLSLALTNMMFSEHQRAFGNEIIFSSNRLQYASNKTKLEVSSQLFDRGILNRNEIADIWNLPKTADGDKYYIRKEYAEISKFGKGEVGVEQIEIVNTDEGGNDNGASV